MGQRGKLTLPALLSDESGIDWRELYEGWMEARNWTPWQIANEIGLLQMFALWGTNQGGGDSILDDDDVGQSRDDQLSLLNRFRARHGLPPVKPREGA